MRVHTRLAISAVVLGLRKSGAIDDTAIAAIVDELTAAAKQVEHYGQGEHAEVVALAEDIAAGRVRRGMYG